MAAPVAVIDRGDFEEVVARPGLLESFGRGVVEGATFGFDGKVGGEAWKQAREASRRENPWTHFAGEIVGGVAPLVYAGPAGGIAAGGRALAAVAPRAGAALQTAGRATAVLNPARAATYGEAASQGLRAGVASGVLSGAGHSEGKQGETWLEMAEGGIVGGAIGAVAGPLVHGGINFATSRAGARAAARAEMDAPQAGAVNTLSRNLERDRITPDDIEANIRDRSLPVPGQGGLGRRYGSGPTATAWDDAMIERVTAIVADEPTITPRELGQRLAADPDLAGLPVPGTTALRGFLEAWQDVSAPLNITDRAGMIRPGAGENTQWSLRAAMNTPEARGIGRESLEARQLGAGGRLEGAINRTVGSTDLEAARDAHQAAFAVAKDRAYNQAAADYARNPQDIGALIEPIVRETDSSVANLRGERPEGMRRAIDSIYRDEPLNPSQITLSPGRSGNSQVPRPAAQELPMSDREQLLRTWDYARQRTPRPETLSAWVARYVGKRGILDPGGDVATLGDRRLGNLARPDRGISLDDITQAAHDQGFFGPPMGARTATINDLLEALDNDLRGNPQVRIGPDQDLLDEIADKARMMRDLADVGVTGRTRQEIMEQLGLIPGSGNRATTQPVLPRTLDEFKEARTNVRQAVDKERNTIPRRPDGSDGPPTPLLGDLNAFYARITEVVGNAYPSWRFANNLFRDGRAVQEALDAGQGLGLRLGTGSREALVELERLQARAVARAGRGQQLTPQQEIEREAAEAAVNLFRVGFARSLMDRMVNNKGDTHALAADFRRPAAREIVTRVLGREQALRFLRAIEAEDHIHRTYSRQFGSQTTPLKAAMDDQSWSARFSSAMRWLNPWAYLDAGLEHMAAGRNAARNQALVPMLTDTNPKRQLDTLQAVRGVHRARQNVAGSRGAAVARQSVPAGINAFEGEQNVRRRAP